jgi:predicted flap endonuclease-1-like 5' DNA nuclease
MLFSSPSQLLVLCAVAVIAWLLGFATNPKTAHRGIDMRKLERDFANFRSQSQSRLNTLARHAATLEATHQTMVDRLAEAEARIATFKAASPARTAAPVEPQTGDDAHSAFDHDAADPIVPPLTPGETAAPPPLAEVFPELATVDASLTGDAALTPEPSQSRSGIGTRDVLTRIDGIDAALELRLLELGISRFEEIEKLSDQDEMALELRLALPAGYITGRQWRQQAAALHARDLAELATRFGPSRAGDA